jgi:general secretion pathway protein M
MTALSLKGHSLRNLLTRDKLLPLLGYAGSLLSLIAIAWLALATLADDYAQYRSAADTLARLEGRRESGGPGRNSALPGSPLLEGPTIEVAGAALQQRFVAAVKKAGGQVLSTQIDLKGSESKPGSVILSANCEIDQDNLQQLLYDLEAGMPFLFIEQLVIQLPQSDRGIGQAAEPARMRVQIDLSGQWQVTK